MSDLINGREMLKRYQVDLCYGIACKECSMCTEDGGCRVEEWIDKFPSADRPQEWIPCSERLPESQGYYICTCKDGSKYKRASAVKWSNGWQLTGARAYWIVLAWMPLPEPWKGADDE